MEPMEWIALGSAVIGAVSKSSGSGGGAPPMSHSGDIYAPVDASFTEAAWNTNSHGLSLSSDPASLVLVALLAVIAWKLVK